MYYSKSSFLTFLPTLSRMGYFHSCRFCQPCLLPYIQNSMGVKNLISSFPHNTKFSPVESNKLGKKGAIQSKYWPNAKSHPALAIVHEQNYQFRSGVWVLVGFSFVKTISFCPVPITPISHSPKNPHKVNNKVIPHTKRFIKQPPK